MTAPQNALPRASGTFSYRSSRAMELADFWRHGIFARQLATALGIEVKDASKTLQRLKDLGHLRTLMEVTPARTRRVRYYLPIYEADAMAAHEHWRSMRACNLYAEEVEEESPPPGAPAPAAYPCSVAAERKPIAVLSVPEFFSRPGYRPAHLGQETWAAQVYGSRA